MLIIIILQLYYYYYNEIESSLLFGGGLSGADIPRSPHLQAGWGNFGLVIGGFAAALTAFCGEPVYNFFAAIINPGRVCSFPTWLY